MAPPLLILRSKVEVFDNIIEEIISPMRIEEHFCIFAHFFGVGDSISFKYSSESITPDIVHDRDTFFGHVLDFCTVYQNSQSSFDVLNRFCTQHVFHSLFLNQIRRQIHISLPNLEDLFKKCLHKYYIIFYIKSQIVYLFSI